MQLLTLLSLALAALAVLFALQNTGVVTVSFFFWQFESSLALMLLLAVLAGALLVALASTPATVRRQWQAARQQKRIAELSARVAALTADIARAGQAAAPGSTQTPPPERPYVGLREIIAGAPPEEPPPR